MNWAMWLCIQLIAGISSLIFMLQEKTIEATIMFCLVAYIGMNIDKED